MILTDQVYLSFSGKRLLLQDIHGYSKRILPGCTAFGDAAVRVQSVQGAIGNKQPATRKSCVLQNIQIGMT